MSDSEHELPSWFRVAQRDLEDVATWPKWEKAAMQARDIPGPEELSLVRKSDLAEPVD